MESLRTWLRLAIVAIPLCRAYFSAPTFSPEWSGEQAERSPAAKAGGNPQTLGNLRNLVRPGLIVPCSPPRTRPSARSDHPPNTQPSEQWPACCPRSSPRPRSPRLVHSNRARFLFFAEGHGIDLLQLQFRLFHDSGSQGAVSFFVVDFFWGRNCFSPVSTHKGNFCSPQHIETPGLSPLWSCFGLGSRTLQAAIMKRT